MRLEEYWGIGPKTSDLLTEELGIERAVDAIESTDTRALTEAGLSRGRATRILRRATGKEAMDLLATRDTRDVYKSCSRWPREHAVTDRAVDNISRPHAVADPGSDGGTPGRGRGRPRGLVRARRRDPEDRAGGVHEVRQRRRRTRCGPDRHRAERDGRRVRRVCAAR